MIADSLKNKETYRGLAPDLIAALDYCATVKAAGFEVKTVELDGRKVYAMHQAYTSEGDAGHEYETHRRYIDVQYVLEGEETIRVADAALVKATKPYDGEKDFALFAAQEGTDVRLRAGDFAVLYPHDAHMPKLATGKPVAVKKIVVKVAL